MSAVVPAEAGTQKSIPWIPAFAGKTHVILLEALRKDRRDDSVVGLVRGFNVQEQRPKALSPG